MNRTATRLADGRELVYYDERPGADRSAADGRDLPAVATSSELRLDRLRDEWVIVAAHRQTRTFLPPAELCPLCPSAPGRATEIPAADYDVAVFANRFPSLAEDVQGAVTDGLVPRRPGVGRCEVVCFTAEHTGSLGALPDARRRLVVDVWAERTEALGALPGVGQVFPFENRGEEIGVTLSHPHGQIYAYPFVAPVTARQLASARRHRDATGRCLFCELVAFERDAGERVLADGPSWAAFVPAAARWPFEVHLYPRRHVPDLPALGDAERDELAVLLGDVLRRFDALFGAPLPYMLAWHQAPVAADRDVAHLHAELFSIRRAADRLKYLAASESAAGVFINDVVPERAAAMLREAKRPWPGCQ